MKTGFLSSVARDHFHRVTSVLLKMLASNRTAQKRDLSSCKSLLLRLQAGFCIPEQNVCELSLLPIPPVLHDFPLLRLHESVDTYAIFYFEPLHFLSLGLIEVLKKCLYRYFSNPDSRSTAPNNTSRDPKPFYVIQKRVLNWLKTFLMSNRASYILKRNKDRLYGRWVWQWAPRPSHLKQNLWYGLGCRFQ